MRKFFYLSAIVFLSACTGTTTSTPTASSTPSTSFSTEGKVITVFTTADSSNLRLTATDTLSFQEMGKPFETQNWFFVVQTKKFKNV